MGHPKNWFEEWFNSPYYHCLYQNRNQTEAEVFLRAILKYLNPKKNTYFLDMACGRGRHASFLGQLGYMVHGVDLSPNNIEFAKQSTSVNLTFEVLDIRNFYRSNEFDYILSLYTSFGYFEADSENMKLLSVVYNGLKNEGTFVLDYLNPVSVKNHMVPYEKKVIENKTFEIRKQCFDQYVLKTIDVTDGVKKIQFTEYVKLYNIDGLKWMFEKAGLSWKAVFGDYNLGKFDEINSERVIVVANKEN